MTSQCKICDSKELSPTGLQPSYLEGSEFSIYLCETCFTSVASPTQSDPEIYETIYADPSKVRGYDRYDRYRAMVLEAKDPLRSLAGAEDMYWAVSRALGDLEGLPTTSLLEVGSGLGYLTYALNKTGFSCIGIDLSDNAVEEATEYFGDHYKRVDLHELVDAGNKYDVVISTEVIEHVEDPIEFLRDAYSLLKPGGRLIVSTPNKSNWSKDVLWHTDPPPVHLFWFSEKSFESIAQKLGASFRLVDFTERNRLPRYYPRLIGVTTPTESPRIATKTLAKPSIFGPPRQWLKNFLPNPVLEALKMGRGALSPRYSRFGNRSSSLCAILERPTD
ncbi:MAG: SAM-dependent methyltransferase [Candidatus Poriferisodalaceae bacterium]|jgi:SAM-dependent methyltransferase